MDCSATDHTSPPLVKCHFPTSSTQAIGGDTWENISIPNIDKNLFGLEKNERPCVEQVQAAWAVLLHKYVGQDAVCFGMFTCSSKDDTLGCSGRPESVRWAGILQYEGVQSLMSKLQPDVVHPLNEGTVKKSEINTAIHLHAEGCACYSTKSIVHHYDLILHIGPIYTSDYLSLSIRSPKISVRYGAVIAAAFQSYLLRIAVTEPSQPAHSSTLADIGILLPQPPIELRKVESCVHYEITKVVKHTADREAICSWDGSLTYSQLDELSTQAAKHLVRSGCQPGTFVLFMVEKSLWAVVAALAILKAGGALVPLDPAHPEARRATIMRCTDARMAVTSDCLKYLFDGLPITAITISAVKASASHQSELSEVHLPVVTPKDPVFVLFTSGSTGEPKGIIHEHTGICSHAAAQVERMGYKGARVFQFSAFTFDVAMMDIFSTLIAGSTVCVPSEDERLNNIPAAIARMNADHALVTPSIASLISPNEVPTLKTLILGGESLNRKVIDHWVDHVQLMNAYGPAEVGACTVATVNRNQTRIETIGLPLPHCSCWVVDVNDHDELLPAGAIGELLVTGTTLARGYLNNKAKTDASFIRSPLWASRMGLTAAIFYKTGDLVRYNIDMLDGTLDYIGRKDAQVKLRGYRIELGEIEYHISTYPGVVRSVVLQPRQGYYAGQLVVIAQVISGTLDDNNDPLYIRTCDGPKVEAIQRHLAPFVPNYMLPSECIAVEMLPLNRSCKIDRNAVSQWLSNLAERPVQKASAHVQWYPLIDKSNALAVSICARISELVAERDVEFAALIKGRDIPLEKLELDSIQLMTLTMYLRRTYGSCITLGHMRPGTTVTKIANLIASGRVNEAHDLPSEFNVGIEANSIFEEMTGELLADGPNTTCQNPAPILNVFLTGATGFLGLEILRQLLHQPKIKIFVLLRCGTDMEGYERILRMAKEHGWWKDGFARRIHVWPGDLTQPDLGLSPGALSQLTGEAPRTNSIDAIIHCAARVHYTYDYQTLKPANVDSTVQLLKTMAGTTTISAFLYVSGGEAPNAERHKLDNASSPDYANGYSQSKLVSELIVTRCAQHSLFQGRRLKIVRPGYIIGSPAQPRPVTTDFIWRLVAGCLDIKAYNGETLSQWIYISDVESVGQVVVDSVLDQTCTTTYFPVLGGLSLGEFWGVLSTDIGYHLEPLAEEEWLQALEADILRRRESHPLFPFLLIIRQEAKSLGSKISHVRDSRVKRAVLGNIQYLINVGFLPRPLSN